MTVCTTGAGKVLPPIRANGLPLWPVLVIGIGGLTMLDVAAGAILAAVTPVPDTLSVYSERVVGGNYLNYSWLMSSAQAQKDEEDRTSSFSRDPLADFQDSLQRQILSALSRELIYNRFGDLDLTREGRFDLGDYIVEIIPGLDGTSIKIFSVLTGDESVVTIPSY